MHTKQQIAIMEKCRGGMRWVFHQRGQMLEDDLMRVLIAEGLVQARCDIGDDIYCLTYKGEAVLDEREHLIEHPNDVKEIHEPQEREPCTDSTNKFVKLRKIWRVIVAIVCFGGSIFGIVELVEWVIAKMFPAVP